MTLAFAVSTLEGRARLEGAARAALAFIAPHADGLGEIFNGVGDDFGTYATDALLAQAAAPSLCGEYVFTALVDLRARLSRIPPCAAAPGAGGGTCPFDFDAQINWYGAQLSDLIAGFGIS
ncbi:hypothetical protein [Rhodovulum steppense]|uniref:Uncharacterized protein n=1 Tax=Rhodovulum steppense TaxID=540251 RepID=A0A4R1YJ85_9RHOB|nr:hypothetical protein [Rhodovulum steppense]TCM76379.1 hypothetical protein EV216_1347 [Rhodovulum steppense]